ncbi:hypothetical protein [uncultured Croceitalea sp.]|uniref:hypothetical protein n=1 Tax=uncultured Croceitalea sp. TaxID=1798908 RepID=UPI0033061AEC
MKKTLLILFGFVINFISCQQKTDLSKTLEEYYALGFPKIEMDWSEQDLENAIKSIENLKVKDEFALPKMDSPKSSKYFDKIILELPKVDSNDSLRPNYQFRKFGEFERFLTRLAFAYGPEERFQIYYSNEAIEINKLTIQEITKVGQLYQSMVNRMSDSIRQLNKENDIKFEGGILKVYEASLETHESYNKFDTEDKIELAKVISKNLTKVWPLMTNNSKNSLTNQIKSISTENEIKEVRDLYKSLITKLK